MPNRWLKESYLASSRLNAASAEARDCWVRLVVVADDYGLFHANPQLVASRCYPLNPNARKCAQLLDELETVHLIARYQVEGRAYLRIEQWYERARAGPKYPSPPTSASNCAQPQASADVQGEQVLSPTYTPYNHVHVHDHGIGAQAREPKRSRTMVITEPSTEHRALAQDLGLDCEGELVRYHDHFAANGKRHVNEDAGFRNWLKNSKDFKGKRKNGVSTLTEKRVANMDAITGRKRDERTFDADAVGGTLVRPALGDIRQSDDGNVGRRTEG